MSTLNPGNLSVFITSVGTTVNPGSGNELTIAVIAGLRSELINLSFQFAADGNAGVREIYLEHHHDAVVNRLGSVMLPFTANETFHVICNQSATVNTAAGVGSVYLGIPHYPLLFEDDTLVVKVSNIQVGDAITSIYHAWKHWTFQQ